MLFTESWVSELKGSFSVWGEMNGSAKVAKRTEGKRMPFPKNTYGRQMLTFHRLANKTYQKKNNIRGR